MTFSANSWACRARSCCATVGVRSNVMGARSSGVGLTVDYPVPADSTLLMSQIESGRRPRLADGEVENRGSDRSGVVLAARQQCSILGELPGADLPRGDPAQSGVRLGQLLALAIL